MFGSPKKVTAQEAQPSLLDSYDESSLTENEENLDLYEKLRTLRNIIAKNEDLQPFQVFNNETIKQLSKAAPVAIAELTSIKGIGPAKIDKWGILVLEVIKMWRKEQL